ncbi:MAG: hypothetical protein WEB62_08725, partial [Bacteroidota bacterium]
IQGGHHSMTHFLIESPHTKQDCAMIVKETMAIGYLTHFYWGCKTDDHRAWAIIEAENEKEALLSVPSLLRGKSKAIQIVQFDPKEVQMW